EGAGSRTLRAMRPREQLTLDQAVRRAAAGGTVVRHDAVAVFLEVLRVAVDLQTVPDAATTFLEEDGSLTFAAERRAETPDPAEPIRAAGRLATGLFAAANLEPPLALARAAGSAPQGLPAPRHFGGAFALAFLLSGPPPPTQPEPPARAALVPEIPLPRLDAPAAPAVVDPRRPPRERAAPAAAAPSSEAAPRPSRKLRRGAAAPDAAAAARAKLQLGDESLKQGRFFEALMAFREALDQDPPLPAAARRLGDAYRAHQDDDLAVAAYERYLELD